MVHDLPATVDNHSERSRHDQWPPPPTEALWLTSGSTYDRQGSLNCAWSENSPTPISLSRSRFILVTWLVMLLSRERTWQTAFTNSSAGLCSGRWEPGKTGNSAARSCWLPYKPDNFFWIFCVMLQVSYNNMLLDIHEQVIYNVAARMCCSEDFAGALLYEMLSRTARNSLWSTTFILCYFGAKAEWAENSREHLLT